MYNVIRRQRLQSSFTFAKAKQADQQINQRRGVTSRYSQSIYRGSSFFHAPKSVSRGHNLCHPFFALLICYLISSVLLLLLRICERTPNTRWKCHTEWLHTRTQFAIYCTFSLDIPRAQRYRYFHVRSSTILVFLNCFSEHTPILTAARYCRIRTEFRDYSHLRKQSVRNYSDIGRTSDVCRKSKASHRSNVSRSSNVITNRMLAAIPLKSVVTSSRRDKHTFFKFDCEIAV